MKGDPFAIVCTFLLMQLLACVPSPMPGGLAWMEWWPGPAWPGEGLAFQASRPRGCTGATDRHLCAFITLVGKLGSDN